MRATRRDFLGFTGSALAALAASPGCLRDAAGLDAQSTGRLKARPQPAVKTIARGRSQLNLGRGRDGVLQMPSVIPEAPLPLIVLLHGAGGEAGGLVDWLGPTCDRVGVATLSLDSRGSTWDAIRDDFGPDVAFIDRALSQVFGRVGVDANRVAIGGFSDGATYGLSLGLINGDLFRKIVAFSPGFLIPGAMQGKPRIFISHGTADKILPIDRCSRIIVPELRGRGYDVTFREFAGGHGIPDPIAADGLGWVAAR
jgi:phospholipase/carboxylesterase